MHTPSKNKVDLNQFLIVLLHSKSPQNVGITASERRLTRADIYARC